MTIALGAGLASLAMNFWVPFLPLYMLRLGATSDANALFWVGVATMGQGIVRVVSAPVWGVLSDRFGRKLMFTRALYFASLTTLIAAFATEPWHIALAFVCQGLFSGFIPAAVALTSVTVPEEKLSASLASVSGGQYLGNTVGPAIGAGLALLLGMRGAILVSALLPAFAATIVLLLVPRDSVSPRVAVATGVPVKRESALSLLSMQFILGVSFYFFLFGVTQLVRLTTPISLDHLTGDDSGAILGLAFTLGGIGSTVGVLFVANRWMEGGSFPRVLALGCVLSGLLHAGLALSPNASVFILVFVLISLAEAAMLPAANTLIAANVPRERRGTAFGFAGSAQALAFMVGPMSAAAFAAISLEFGYVLLGVLFLALAVPLRFVLREPPKLDGGEQPAPALPTTMQKGRLAART